MPNQKKDFDLKYKETKQQPHYIDSNRTCFKHDQVYKYILNKRLNTTNVADKFFNVIL